MERSLTGLEEALQRIGMAVQKATEQYKDLPMLSFRKRAYMQGVIFALGMVFNMLHELAHKHDNSTGAMN